MKLYWIVSFAIAFNFSMSGFLNFLKAMDFKVSQTIRNYEFYFVILCREWKFPRLIQFYFSSPGNLCQLLKKSFQNAFCSTTRSNTDTDQLYCCLGFPQFQYRTLPLIIFLFIHSIKRKSRYCKHNSKTKRKSMKTFNSHMKKLPLYQLKKPM